MWPGAAGALHSPPMARRVSNPPNPWAGPHVEYLGPPPETSLNLFEEEARSIVTQNDSPDVPFRYSVNPYRGCQHGCAYCYARAGHTYLDFSAGTDFETQLIIKVNAPELLARHLARRSWKRDWIAFSGVTDCYQPIEASYGLTRECLKVCLARRNPVGIITRGSLIRRDLDVLADLHKNAGLKIHISIPILDAQMCRKLEPSAPTPNTRLETVRRLAESGLDVGVALAPIIPGLNDSQIPAILEAAAGAGASSAFMLLLRLSEQVEPVFRERLEKEFPLRSSKVFSHLEQMRQAQGERHAFGQRMRGAGPQWDTLEGLFQLHCRKLGLASHAEQELTVLRPGAQAQQQTLFGESTES